MVRSRCWTLTLLLSPLVSGAAHADTFGSGANTFTIDFVTIGSPGNPPNNFPPGEGPQNIGSVPYRYGMAKYEISEQMIDAANALGGLDITKDTRGPDFPATSVTWFEAAKFVNWLNTSTGRPAAYKFDAAGDFQLWAPGDPGYNSANRFRNSLALYVLPSDDEWHKAAYYDAALGRYYLYPTGSDTVPDGIDFVGDTVFDAVFFDGANQLGPNAVGDVGVASRYGTHGQGGNVDEWMETAFSRSNRDPTAQRTYYGGNWGGFGSNLESSQIFAGVSPFFSGGFFGLRVVSMVPEPTTSALLGLGCLLVAGRRLYRSRRAEVNDSIGHVASN